MGIFTRVRGALRTAWWWLREVSGDAAYENYLRRITDRSEVLSGEEFYLEGLERRYACVSRCC